MRGAYCQVKHTASTVRLGTKITIIITIITTIILQIIRATPSCQQERAGARAPVLKGSKYPPRYGVAGVAGRPDSVPLVEDPLPPMRSVRR